MYGGHKMSKTKIIPIIFFSLVFLFVISYFNPNLSIRRHIILYNPIAAFSAKIDSHYHNDNQYGHCYKIKGDWKDLATQNPLGNVCIKRKFFVYYVTTQGFD